MKRNKRYPAACIVLAAGIAAMAVIYGVTAWHAAGDQEEEMAYLRSFDWEAPLTESWAVTAYGDDYFHSDIGDSDPAERAAECAGRSGLLKAARRRICDHYLGEQEAAVYVQSGFSRKETYVDESGEVFFLNDSMRYSNVESLTDTYAVVFDGAENYRLTDLNGQVIYEAEEGQRIQGIDNRYAAVGAANETRVVHGSEETGDENTTYVYHPDYAASFEYVYDLEERKLKKLPESYGEIRRWSGGWYKGLVPAPENSGREAWMVFLDEDMKTAMGGKTFDAETFYGENHLRDGLFYGVRPGSTKEEATQQGYFDRSGKLVLPAKNAEWASDFSEGKGIVYASGQNVYCIDGDGRILFEKKISKEPFLETDTLSWKSAFRGGRAVIFDGKKCGVTDASGAWLVQPVFDQIYLGDDDRAVVIRGEKFGVIHFDEEAAK